MKKILAALLCAVMLLGCASALAETWVTYTYYVQTTGDVNVRTGPGLNYSKLGYVDKGTTLDYLGMSSVDDRNVAWYKVMFNNNIGWVSSVYSTLHQKANTGTNWQPDTSTPSVQLDTYVRATGSVNVRTGAGKSYESLGSLRKGEKVLYLDTYTYDANGSVWYKVQYYSFGQAWVSGLYTELVFGNEAGVADDMTNVVGSYVKAKGGNSNVRSGPGLSYEDLGTIHGGEIASYLGAYCTDERGAIWYYVRFGDVTGWVSARYTELY